MCVFVAPAVSADPEPPPQPVAEADPAPPADHPPEDLPAEDLPPEAEELPPEAAEPADPAAVVSTPPATVTTPDGWVLNVSAKDETQTPIHPLTTALSSREYEVGATFVGEITGPDGADETPEGVLEVGYEIGCGIDMSTSQGVSLSGSAGMNPSLGLIATDIIAPDGLPILGANAGIGPSLGGAVTVGLKPGFVNIVPVSKKPFVGADPWVMVSGFRVKIDGCVGESFLRSYAYLTRSTDQSEAVLAWYGTTKQI
ncbi:MspA family porin [Mycolicibacterium thermoresistibile]